MLRQVLERVKPTEEIHGLYIHRFLQTLAVSAITVFLPLYVYNLSSAALPVFVFFLVYYGVMMLSVLPSALLTSKIGYKKAAFTASPFILLFYYLLQTLKVHNWTLYGVAAVGGIGFALYWTGINAEFVGSSEKRRREEQTGFFVSIPILASILSPFLGGVILAATGFDTLFLLVIFVLALSYVPFLFSPERYRGMEAGTKIFEKRNLNDFFMFFFRGIATIGRKAVWPLYLGIIITGSLNIGGAGSLVALGGALVNVVLGKYLDRDNRVQVLTAGGILFAVSWVGMAFVVTPLQAFIISFLNGLLMHTVNLPVYSGALGIAGQEEDVLKYLAFRDIALGLGRLTVLGGLIVLFLELEVQNAFLGGFSIIAAAVLGIIYFGSKVRYER